MVTAVPATPWGVDPDGRAWARLGDVGRADGRTHHRGPIRTYWRGRGVGQVVHGRLNCGRFTAQFTVTATLSELACVTLCPRCVFEVPAADVRALELAACLKIEAERPAEVPVAGRGEWVLGVLDTADALDRRIDHIEEVAHRLDTSLDALAARATAAIAEARGRLTGVRQLLLDADVDAAQRRRATLAVAVYEGQLDDHLAIKRDQDGWGQPAWPSQPELLALGRWADPLAADDDGNEIPAEVAGIVSDVEQRWHGAPDRMIAVRDADSAASFLSDPCDAASDQVIRFANHAGHLDQRILHRLYAQHLAGGATVMFLPGIIASHMCLSLYDGRSRTASLCDLGPVTGDVDLHRLMPPLRRWAQYGGWLPAHLADTTAGREAPTITSGWIAAAPSYMTPKKAGRAAKAVLPPGGDELPVLSITEATESFRP